MHHRRLTAPVVLTARTPHTAHQALRHPRRPMVPKVRAALALHTAHRTRLRLLHPTVPAVLPLPASHMVLKAHRLHLLPTDQRAPRLLRLLTDQRAPTAPTLLPDPRAPRLPRLLMAPQALATRRLLMDHLDLPLRMRHQAPRDLTPQALLQALTVPAPLMLPLDLPSLKGRTHQVARRVLQARTLLPDPRSLMALHLPPALRAPTHPMRPTVRSRPTVLSHHLALQAPTHQTPLTVLTNPTPRTRQAALRDLRLPTLLLALRDRTARTRLQAPKNRTLPMHLAARKSLTLPKLPMRLTVLLSLSTAKSTTNTTLRSVATAKLPRTVATVKLQATVKDTARPLRTAATASQTPMGTMMLISCRPWTISKKMITMARWEEPATKATTSQTLTNCAATALPALTICGEADVLLIVLFTKQS